ncbi:flagellar FliL protein [Halanaerobium saccharolyticum]|uniref:Flagellar protein FliL n=1 Tax=Halanaerobium saccharolyticum TaxID=43595 RepID=A0A4R6M3J6_9FIRM|nr:flagellar basal body-associated FliL family protein [Halanaerobium saccharolyticum]TDO94469.1 flagellar FliL protein [Halanaerobium saccharolyticum]
MAEEGQMNYKMLALIVVLVIIITGVASFTFFTYFSVSSDDKNNEKEITSIEDIRPTYNAGDYTVNISNNNQINFVRASIVFELESTEMVKELDKRSAQIRDRIISTLRAQNEEILKEPGANTIKKIVKDKVNEILISGKITNVWFTELVVQ